MRTLITCATSAEAYKLKNALHGKDIVLGDHLDLPVFIKGFVTLPKPNSASYQHEMLTLCLDHGITEVYLLTNEELQLLRESELLFNEYNISIIDGRAAI